MTNVLAYTLIYRFLPSHKAELAFFFPHVSRAQQHLAPARTRTRVVRLEAQCTDHWTTEQSRGGGAPAVQLTTHVKRNTLYGRTVVHPLLFCIIMGLRSASSAIINHIRSTYHKNARLYFQSGSQNKEGKVPIRRAFSIFSPWCDTCLLNSALDEQANYCS